jgi:hypothetical protein
MRPSYRKFYCNVLTNNMSPSDFPLSSYIQRFLQLCHFFQLLQNPHFKATNDCPERANYYFRTICIINSTYLLWSATKINGNSTAWPSYTCTPLRHSGSRCRPIFPYIFKVDIRSRWVDSLKLRPLLIRWINPSYSPNRRSKNILHLPGKWPRRVQSL